MLLLLVACLQTPQIADPAARKVVDKMAAVYRTCKTYQDTGTVVSGTEKIDFKTSYKAPGKLYFEFDTKSNVRVGRFVLWSNGVRKKVWQSGVDGPGYWLDTYLTNAWLGDDKKLEKDQPMEMEIAGFTGISLGSVDNVIGMLLPKQAYGPGFSAYTDLKLAGTETVQGHPCSRLKSVSHHATIWIDSKTSLLIKLDEEWDPTQPHEITIYKGSINKPVADSVFNFTPPKK